MAESECLLLAQLSPGKDFSGLLTDSGVDVEVLEEDLRTADGGSAALGVVLRLDVDGRGHGGVRVIEGSGLAVGALPFTAWRNISRDHPFAMTSWA